MRTLLLLILLIVIITVYRPRGVWREVMRLWGQRDYVLRVTVVVVGIYLLYGLYNMYERGMLSLDWYPWYQQ
jgi:hypothetical protein